MKQVIGEIITDARKAQAAALGLLLQLVALGVLHGTLLHYVQVAVAVLTAAGVYLAPNGPLGDPLKGITDTGPGTTELPPAPAPLVVDTPLPPATPADPAQPAAGVPPPVAPSASPST